MNSPCGLCGGQSGTGTCFYPVTSVIICQFCSTMSAYSLNWHRLYKILAINSVSQQLTSRRYSAGMFQVGHQSCFAKRQTPTSGYGRTRKQAEVNKTKKCAVYRDFSLGCVISAEWGKQHYSSRGTRLHSLVRNVELFSLCWTWFRAPDTGNCSGSLLSDLEVDMLIIIEM